MIKELVMRERNGGIWRSGDERIEDEECEDERIKDGKCGEG